MNQRLGELLVRENLINIAQLQEAEGHQRSSGERLGYALTKLGYIEASDLTQFLSQQYGVPSIDLDAWDIEPTVYMTKPSSVLISLPLLCEVKKWNVFPTVYELDY